MSSLVIAGVLIASWGESAFAQLVPDTTLGSENSTFTPLTPTIDQIDGGATRGTNLFHSFQEFNVGEGRGAYFANPTGIENILTRVTGGNASNILGRLGVLGEANLFLLNPNGILFGPNASLDIRGSFLATTAERIQLGDSGYFNAAQPQTSSLLSVSPGALFFNAVANQPTSIINQGNLATGKNLTLSAGNLDLQGQLLSGRDLTLQAQDTVKVRDSVATTFLAQSGENLTIVGKGGIDILALNHPTQTPFVSGGNLSLISDGVISGDARFSSGGSFSIKSISGGLANFVSYYDPIISASGDVDVAANYTGTSLLVEATGNIRFGGNINITGPDTNTLPAGPDTDTLRTTSALIMRSGQSALAYGGVNLGNVPNYDTPVLPEGITIGGNVVVQPFNGVGGIVNLTAASGNVSTGFISTNGSPNPEPTGYFGNGANGGAITISAANNINITGDLFSYSYSFPGNAGNAAEGGAISLTAANDINITGNLFSYSYSSFGGNAGGAISLTAANDINITGTLLSYSYSSFGNAAEGGAISLTAANDINITGTLTPYSSSSFGNAGNGGAISLTAANDINFTGNLLSYSSSDAGNAGNGGAISLTAANDINITGTLLSYSSSSEGNAGDGGAISLTAANDINFTGNLLFYSYSSFGNAGDGGAISLTAANDINFTGTLTPYSSSDAGNAGNGGAISLTAANDINFTGNLFSYSYSSFGNAAEGGAISLTAANDINFTGNLFSYSYSSFGNAAEGGAISLTAANDIFIKGSLYSHSYSRDGTAGQGGEISLIARSGDIVGIPSESTRYDPVRRVLVTEVSSPILSSFSISEQGTAGYGGNVAIEAKNQVSNLEIFTLSSDSQSGKVQVTGLGDLSLADTNILTRKQVSIPNPLQAPGEFITLNVGGKGQSGDVTVTSSGNLTFNNSSIQSDTQSSDPAGNVTVSSPGLVTFNNSFIRSNTSSEGAAGRVDIEAGQGIMLVGSDSQLFAGTTNIGKAGDITLTTPQLTLQNGTSIATTTASSSPAGNITLQSHPKVENLNINLAPGTSISASTSNLGTGGNIEIKAANAITIQGQSTITTETTGAGNAGKIQVTSRNLDIQQTELSTSTTGSGNAGDITLDTSTLTVARGAKIFALTEGLGNSGTITVNSPTAVNLGIGVDDFSPVLSVETSDAGKAGSIIINTPRLTLSDTARITATATSTATNTEGGGSITLNASTMDLAGVVGVFAETEGQTPAGTLTLQPYENQSTLNLTLAPQSQVSASTSGSGKGGNLIVQAPEAITIQGPGQLAVQTTGDGAAGELRIDTQRLTIADGAQVTVSSEGTGSAGSLFVEANQIYLDNGGRIRADTSGGGGNINLRSPLILLRNGSSITTNARGSSIPGGNIIINTDNLVAVPKENSDISANSANFRGGNVTITASGIFGIEFREQLTPLSDITATGLTSGTVNLITPGIDPSRGLAELPTEVVDATDAIAQGCPASEGNSFVVTGRGGLPPNPEQQLDDDAEWLDRRRLTVAQQTNPGTEGSQQHSEGRLDTRHSAHHPPLIEATGWEMAPTGQVILTASVTNVTPSNRWGQPVNCDRS